MKKIALVVAFATFVFNSFAVSVPFTERPAVNAKNIMIPVGGTDKKISLYELATISLADFKALSGRTMSKADERNFVKAQLKLNKKMNADGTFKKTFAKKMKKAMEGNSSGFHIGGFALGFLLGPIGVLIAYLINDDIKKNRVKWAWLGFAAAIVFSLVFGLLIIGSLF